MPAVGPIAGLRPAGFWIRFVASVVDMIVVGVLTVVVLIPMGLSASAPAPGDDPMAVLAAVAGAFGLTFVVNKIVEVMYYVVFVGWRGQTPGKILFGLKIVRVNGDEVDYVRAFLRWVGYWISNLTLSLGYILAAFTTHNRALHDYIAGTRVIRL